MFKSLDAFPDERDERSNDQGNIVTCSKMGHRSSYFKVNTFDGFCRKDHTNGVMADDPDNRPGRELLDILDSMPYGIVLNSADEIVALGTAFQSVWRDGKGKRFEELFRTVGSMDDGGVQEWLIAYGDGFRRKGRYLPTNDPEYRLLNTWPADRLWLKESPLFSGSAVAESMWHEMRNQLTAIIGVCEQMLFEPKDEEQRSELAAVARSSENLISLLNDIHVGLHPASAEGYIQMGELDLRKCVQQVVRVLAPLARSQKTTVQVSIAPEVAALHTGDSRRVDQVLLNLLGNALKYSPGGEVRIEVLALSSGSDQQQVQLAISDNGVGISAAHMKDLFKPFARDPAQSHLNISGTGLGLSICQELVKLMKGTMTVESLQGKGTTVRITLGLPVLEQNAPVKVEHGGQQQVALPEGINILIVDDGAPIRHVIASMLSRQPVNVLAAENGAQAIAMLCEHSFDVILVDIHMPVVNGPEFAGLVRDTLRSKVPMIAIDGGNGTLAGNVHFKCRVTKPFRQEDLIHVIGACMRRHAAGHRWEPRDRNAGPFSDLTLVRELGPGDNAFIEGVVRSFVDDAPRSMDQLLQAAMDADTLEVAAIAHRLRPSIKMFGIHSVGDLIDELVHCRTARLDPSRVLAFCHIVKRNVLLAVKELSGISTSHHGT